jgi:acetyl-CoA carboxylase biotin carboxyl carrier protein
MAEEHSTPQDNGGPFDLVKLRERVEMMEQHGLTEVSLRRGEERWQLRRGPREVLQTVPSFSAPPAAAAAFAPAPSAPPAAGASAPAQAAPREEGLVIKSEAVGTFYTAPSPDDPPFVTVGTRVEPDTTVCIIEAMKVFNKIEAGLSGVIAEILVESGDAVEFGTPLFRVRPA